MVREQPNRLVRKMRLAADDAAHAEDLAQDVLVRAVRSLAGVRGPADEALLCGWVDAIANNLVRNAHRTRSRRPRPAACDDAKGERVDPTAEPGARVEAEAVRDALASLLERLTPELRTVFVARVVEERSSAEVASELGITENLVRWRLHRARTLLRSWLDDLH